VSAIIAGGTRITDSSSFHMHPSLDQDGDVQWSLSYEQTINTSQSVLASQLAFPDKGSEVVFFGWLALVVFAIGAIISLSYTSDLEAQGNNSGWTTDISSSYETYGNVGAFCAVAAVISFGIAFWATLYHLEGRSAAHQLWSTLYYCFR